MSIYLDHAATTPVDKTVAAAMFPYLTEQFGNASSTHSYGREGAKAVQTARLQVAHALNCAPEEVYFTSGGTESDNWALWGSAQLHRGGHIITSSVEHHAVLRTCQWLERYGYQVTYLAVDPTGAVDPLQVERAIRPDTFLISIMFANNEVGTIMPICAIGKLAREHGILFHTDAVQAGGHIPIDVAACHIDMLSLSAHKFYGPKGVGALFLRSGSIVAPLIHGGGQQHDLRSGTLDTPGIVGLGTALELAVNTMEDNAAHERQLISRLERGLAQLPDVICHGSPDHRLPGHLNATFVGRSGSALMIFLDQCGISVSTGSACSAHTASPSHVLLEHLQRFDSMFFSPRN